MQQTKARSKHYLFLIIPVLIVCLLSSVICHVVIQGSYPHETLAPNSFPNTDLVFTTASGVGFANADGSKETYFDFSAYVPGMIAGTSPADIGRPIVTSDSHLVIAKVSTYISYWYVTNPNLLVLWRSNEYPVFCLSWGLQTMPLLTKDQNHILIHSEEGIAAYDLDSCGTDEEPLSVYKGVSGIISPDVKYVAYTGNQVEAPYDRTITIRNLTSNEERIINQGDFPAWSHDSKSLAYTGVDGIYRVDISKDAEPIRVVLFHNPAGYIHPTYSHINQLPPPEAAWSPDGRWLVYHRLTEVDHDGSDLPNFHSIFKLNIETGEEIKIIDNGIYPYWRWPIEETSSLQ
jgi:hypothetical protein